MAVQDFTLTGEYIELNALLKLLSLASSGGMAKLMISNGDVSVDAQVETRVRRKLRGGEVVQVGDDQVRIVRG